MFLLFKLIKFVLLASICTGLKILCLFVVLKIASFIYMNCKPYLSYMVSDCIGREDSSFHLLQGEQRSSSSMGMMMALPLINTEVMSGMSKCT